MVSARLVDGHVRETVSFFVQLARDVADGVASEPGQQAHDAPVDGLQVRVLDPIPPADLASDQLRIEPEVDMRGAKPQGFLERQLDRGPLGVVVGPHAEELRDLGQCLAGPSIAQDGARAGRAGIAPGGAIGVDQDPQLISRPCDRGPDPLPDRRR